MPVPKARARKKQQTVLSSDPISASDTSPPRKRRKDRTQVLEEQMEEKIAVLKSHNRWENEIMTKWQCQWGMCRNNPHYCYVFGGQHYAIQHHDTQAWGKAIQEGRCTVENPPVALFHDMVNQRGACDLTYKYPQQHQRNEEKKTA